MSHTAAQPREMSPMAALYRLRFNAIQGEVGPRVFPCNREGQVPLDDLDGRARNDYFFARACMGRIFARPVVEEAR